MDFVDLQIVKMSLKALTPTRATKHSVGLDFYSPSDCLIHPLSQVQIPSQIKIRFPLAIVADWLPNLVWLWSIKYM